MIRMIANTEKDYFALEELHEFIGIIVHKPICFLSEYASHNFPLDKNLSCVIFAPAKKPSVIPVIMETRILSNMLYVDTDILGVILDSLSRGEESAVKKDRYARMPLNESLAYKQGIHKTAYVDRLVVQFKAALIAYLQLRGISYSELSPWDRPIVCLTHDVDSIKAKSILRYSYWIISALSTLNRNNIRFALNKIKTLRNVKEDPYFSFSRFTDVESHCDFRSTFFVMSLPFYLSREGRRYSLKHYGLKDELLKVKGKGWEIALHPSRAASRSRKILSSEMKRLMDAVGLQPSSIGIRNHYLAGSFPETWSHLEQLYIKYDSTVGWSECSGFRAGTGKPYRPFHNGLDRRIGIWEIPLITMDSTLGGSADSIFENCLAMAKEAFEYQRPYTILWHTNRLNDIEYPEYYSGYLKLLQYFHEMGCIGTTAAEIIDKYQVYSDDMLNSRRRFDQK